MAVFEELMGIYHQTVKDFPDKRTGKNLSYSMQDIASGAFSVFFTQCASFLEHQRIMQQNIGLNNARTLFSVSDIPTDNHIRKMLDEVSYNHLFPAFEGCLDLLQKNHTLDQFRVNLEGIDTQLLLALDGTWYFDSSTIHCKNCLTKTKDGRKIFYHAILNPSLVKPYLDKVIPLPVECLLPQDGNNKDRNNKDGNNKQDCEQKGAKRWLRAHGKRYAALGQNLAAGVTVLGDDLYCHQPLIQAILDQGLNFILVCKPDSHPTLYEWIKGITEQNSIRHWNGRFHEILKFTIALEVPLKDDKEALTVNFVEVEIVNEKTEEVIYHNAFVTNLPLTQSNVEQIVECGRARWKIENEGNNTLKTKGYHLEHNFGHGQKHLSSFLVTLNILSYLFHTILELMDEEYQKIRGILVKRKTFFHDMKTLLKYVCFSNFHSLLHYMITGLIKPHQPSRMYSAP